MANTIGSDRNYNNWLNGGTPTSSADKVYDAVFTNDDSNQSIQVNDFLNLMITQMTNQDFTNPTDDTCDGIIIIANINAATNFLPLNL